MTERFFALGLVLRREQREVVIEERRGVAAAFCQALLLQDDGYTER